MASGRAPLQSGYSHTLAPGAYQQVTLNSNAHLYLGTGTYYFDGLQTEPGSVVHFDTTAGPIRLVVRDFLMHKGSFEGDPRGILVGLLAETTVNLEGKLVGTLVANRAFVNIQGRNVHFQEASHQGAIFARGIELHQEAVFQHVPFESTWM